MKQYMKQYDLYLTPLSPLHLGTDEDYSPTNYVMDADGLHVFDEVAAMAVMNKDQRDKLERMVSGKPNADMVKAVQKFFADLHRPLRALSTNTVKVVRGVLDQYNARIGKIANRKVLNQLEIERTFYNPVSQQPIIPGSGLKGAIRTALLDHENGGKSHWQPNQTNQTLQQHLFQYREMHQDPLRLLKVQDAIPNPDHPQLAQRQITFAVNRKRVVPKRRDGHINSPDPQKQKGVTQRLEVLSAMSPRAYRSTLSVIAMGSLRKQYGEKVPKQEYSVRQIADYCNDFYRPILDREIVEMEREGYLDTGWRKKVAALLDELEPAFQNRGAFLIRVGRHSGAEPVTLNGVRKIKIKQGPKRPRYEKLPTTWWMAAEREDATQAMIPFGWAVVELVKPTQQPTGNSVMQSIQKALLNDVEKQLSVIRKLKEEARKELEAERRKEQERQQSARREAQLQIEREARRATMSKEQLEVEDLRKDFESAVSSNNFTTSGEVARRRGELLKTALEWKGHEDRRAAHQLLTEMVKALSWSKKKKKKYQALMNKLSESLQ